MEASDNLQNKVSANKAGPIPKSLSKTLVGSGTACGCCTVSVESVTAHPDGGIREVPEGAGNTLEHVVPKYGMVIPADSFTFKTNINCSGCLAKVAPALDAENAIQKWEVDLSSPDKTLRIMSRGISVHQIMKAVRDAGYFIEHNSLNK